MNNELSAADSRLEILSARAEIALLVFVGWSALTLLGGLGELGGLIDLSAYDAGPLEALYSLVLLGYTLVMIGTVIVVSMWIHRAHANLSEAGWDKEYTAGWAIGWYFVPIANLFKPYGAMRELWNLSHGEDNSFAGYTPEILRAWWGFWIIGSIVGNVAFRLQMNGDEGAYSTSLVLGVISDALWIGAALCLRTIIAHITASQQTLNVVEESDCLEREGEVEPV